MQFDIQVSDRPDQFARWSLIEFNADGKIRYLNLAIIDWSLIEGDFSFFGKNYCFSRHVSTLFSDNNLDLRIDLLFEKR